MTTSVVRVWEIIDTVGICMLTTRSSGSDFHARPVEARLERDESCIYVVTSLRSAKEHDIERGPQLGLTFTDQKTNGRVPVSVSAKSTVSSSNQAGTSGFIPKSAGAAQ